MILYKTKESKIVRVDGGTNKQSFKKYSTSITGDGVKTIFSIEHNLDTEDILFEMNDGTEQVLIDYTVVNKNSVTITFAIAPTNTETFNIKIYGILESDSNNSSSDENGDNSADDSTIDPSKIGTINDDWDYTLDETTNIVILNHYTGSDTDVTVYSYYKMNDKVYKTQLGNGERKLGYTQHIFTGKSYIKTITFSDELDTSNVTNMSCMFKACYDLTTINFGNFNTSNVTDMSYMFEICRNLTSVSFNNFDTSNVTDMELMFYNCENLIHLYLTSFDTSNVANMSCMFSGCKNLKAIYVDSAKWTTTNADTEYMFSACGTETVTYI